MPQRLFAGTAEAVNAFIGSTQARRVYHGNTLVWEHPDFPTLDFTSGSLPSTATVPSAGKTQVTYARSGVAYVWQAASPLPVLAQVAADTPRLSVCPPGVDGAQTGQPMGLLFEPAGQNLLPYGRATATGWTSTNVTAGTTTGIDGTSNAARTLTATANGALHYRTTPPATMTAIWLFSAWVKRIIGLGKVWLTLKSGVEIDISAALANFYIDGSDNHQYAWSRVYVAIPGVGPWYGDINTCDRIGFRIDESGDVIAVDAMQLEIGDYPTSEILNDSATLNTRAADRLLIDTNVGGTARRYLLDGDAWAADASAAALLWRIRQERHIARILIEPNGGNWDIDLQTPAENRPNMGWHDGAPSPVIYSISQPEGIPQRDQVYASGYVIEAAMMGDVELTPVLPTIATFAANADGWTGDLTIDGQPGGAIDFGSYASPKFVIEVTSRSWTTSGVETTRARTITGTAIKRQPYPNGTLRVETDNGSTVTLPIVLSEQIYADDTIDSVTISAGWHTDNGTGGTGNPNVEGAATPTNNSALAYPKVLPYWITGDKRHITSSSCVVATTCAHQHAGNGKPVVAVKYIATDQHSHTAEVVVSSMTKYSYTASGLSVPVFEGTLDFSGLDQGDTITIDAVFYPWIGDPYQASVDGEAYPSPNFSVRKCLNDRTGAYGTVYAYVDGVGGGTPAVSTNPATAATTPYSTVAAAASAIQTYNNANFSRNNVSGGIIRLTAAEHVHSSFSARAVGEVPLIIEAANPANKATTIYKDSGTSVMDGVCDLAYFRNLTMKKTGESVIFLDQASSISSDHLLRLENITFDINGTSVYDAWVYQISKLEMVECDGSNISQTAKFSNVTKHVHALGCSEANCIGETCYSVIACIASGASARFFGGPISTGCVAPVGAGILFSHVAYNSTEPAVGIGGGAQNILGGASVVGIISEVYGAGANPALSVSADGVTFTANNCIINQTTVVGDRANILYQDVGTATIQKRGILSNSVVKELNAKSDYFPTENANRTGNWEFRYKVGCRNLAAIRGSNNADSYGHYQWLGELAGKNEVFGTDGAPLTVNWTNDKSKTGDNSGKGDYRPTAGHAIPLVPAIDVAYPWDLLGQPIPLDGTAVAGACQVTP